MCLLRLPVIQLWRVQSLPAALKAAALPLCAPPAAIDEVRTRGESCGGEVTCVVRGCPKGLGSPVFDKLEAELAKAVMSLPATKVRRGGRGRCSASSGRSRGDKEERGEDMLLLRSQTWWPCLVQ